MKLDKKALAEQYLNLSGTQRNLRNGHEWSLFFLYHKYKISPSVVAETNADDISFAGYCINNIKLVLDFFSESDLEKMIAFFSSDVGKKLAGDFWVDNIREFTEKWANQLAKMLEGIVQAQKERQ